jgi:hypothetical protein
VVMVNFMCQFDWAIGVPRHLVKHGSGCVCGDVLRDMTVEPVD